MAKMPAVLLPRRATVAVPGGFRAGLPALAACFDAAAFLAGVGAATAAVSAGTTFAAWAPPVLSRF
jgi:hypothetical protein